jgi:hypothetical protein
VIGSDASISPLSEATAEWGLRHLRRPLAGAVNLQAHGITCHVDRTASLLSSALAISGGVRRRSG